MRKRNISSLIFALSALSVSVWVLKKRLLRPKVRDWSSEDTSMQNNENIGLREVDNVDGSKYKIEIKNDDSSQRMTFKMINPFMKVCLFFRRIAPLATLATAIIAFLALKESMLQRENMYRPELYLGETKFFADINDSVNIKYYPMSQDSILTDKPVPHPYLKINNIGMGAALRVDGLTKFSWESSIPVLANLKMPSQNGMSPEKVVYKHVDDSLVLFNVITSWKWKTDYILPVAQVEEGHIEYVYVPDFKQLVKVSLWLIELLEIPVVYCTVPLELSYRDINEKKYVRETDLLIKCSKSLKSKDRLFITICSGQAFKETSKELKEVMHPKD